MAPDFLAKLPRAAFAARRDTGAGIAIAPPLPDHCCEQQQRTQCQDHEPHIPPEYIDHLALLGCIWMKSASGPQYPAFAPKRTRCPTRRAERYQGLKRAPLRSEEHT